MAKGFNDNQQRQQSVSMFGKDLARRCKSKCELTGASGVSLHVFEIPPTKGEADFDRCIMVCEDVVEQISNPKKFRAEAWRHLNELIWTDVPAVQMMTVRILQHLAPQHNWAQDILDEAFIDEDILELAAKAKLGD